MALSRLINEASINGSRTVAHIDFDAFEWQVVCREHPDYCGRPGIVVNLPGRIVAVSYEAREYGISRKKTKSVKEAQALCPDLIVHYKDMEFGKPESRFLRECSRKIKDCILEFLKTNKIDVIFDYASNDEFFLDITQAVNKSILHGTNVEAGIRAEPHPQRIFIESTRQKQTRDMIVYRLTKVHPKAGNDKSGDQKRYDDEVRLIHGAVLVSRIIAAIYQETKFTCSHCSAGISHNMLLAKLACGLNKPNGITMLPLAGLSRVSKRVTVDSIPGLGGFGPNSFGAKLRRLGIYTMHQLQLASMRRLNQMFKAENCHRLIAWGHGISHDPVQQRTMKSSLTCGKESVRIAKFEDLSFWFGGDHLGGELWERLEEERVHNHRRPTRVAIQVRGNVMGSFVWDWEYHGTRKWMLGKISGQLQQANVEYPISGAIKLFVPEFVPV